MSFFAWLDYSEHERRKMLDVIDLFREKDTRDELGISSVRDAFADLLFPGTSTIQTRARYFLFIPWIYLDIESRRPSSTRQAAGLLREYEIELIRELLKSNDTNGIIGKLAQERLQRLPSNIYWNGLLVWGLRLYTGAQDQYNRLLPRQVSEKERYRDGNGDGDDVERDLLPNWHRGLPQAPEGFPKGSTFALTRDEAN